ncbi:MAG: acetoacetate--CoA ligase [Rhodobacterales bacterium]|nr:acetoacetate--CoA ligase [Rhodobacterales bacterium]
MTEVALWTPSADQIQAANLTRFIQAANVRFGLSLQNYDDLWRWSVTELADFWALLWDFAKIRGHQPFTQVIGAQAMPGTQWFTGSTLNYAENLMSRSDDHLALIEVEQADHERTLTYAELHQQVAKVAYTLRGLGVVEGDRVAAFMPNRIEAVVGMLAATSIGAIWSSCSPDFGAKGVLDRFGQIAPKVLIACDGYRYGRKSFSSLDRLTDVLAKIGSIEHLLLVPVLNMPHGLPGSVIHWQEALDNDATEVAFTPVAFDHPLYIMYSSGTTGVPKCIVHGHGGTLLQHAKEHLLHGDLRPDDRLFYFTTCGWMMWNWLVSGLMAGSTLVLFDGSPGAPDLNVLWQMADRLQLTHFGTSPKFLSSCAKAGVHPNASLPLSALRVVFSTGAPLSADLFHWVYDHVKTDVQLASICGGTDIISCFMGGSCIDPVYAGEIQKRGLAMKVEAWRDANDPVIGEKGELVCAAPFPSMPVQFWNDANDAKYHKAYFAHYPGVWRHGDFVEVTERGGVRVFGRSDATLNPGGIRIGTAEIYRVVEGLTEVVDSVVIGQRWRDDTRVVLFVVLREGTALDEALVGVIKRAVRSGCTPRHVPAVVLQVPDIPRTISGKKVEIAVTRMVQNEPVANRDALINPQALDAFLDLEALS